MCSNRRTGAPARVLAIVLAVGIQCVMFPTFAGADAASLSGQILAGSEALPLANAVAGRNGIKQRKMLAA